MTLLNPRVPMALTLRDHQFAAKARPILHISRCEYLHVPPAPLSCSHDEITADEDPLPFYISPGRDISIQVGVVRGGDVETRPLVHRPGGV